MNRNADWRSRTSGRLAIGLPALILAMAGLTRVANAGPAECPDLKNALGVSRTIAIDASSGHLFGSMTSLPREPSFLAPKEVVLTFDDGPMPWVTKSILGTLDRFCTKATFFSVGRMAMAYPGTVRDVLSRGHTLASHTYSHPVQLPHLAPNVAHTEIDRGVAAVSAAAGIEIAPFFRFPGLTASRTLVDYAASRGLVTFTVDVVSNDSYIRDPDELTRHTLREIEARGRGIILFHDIKSTTAKALPNILEGLASRGYRVVHLVARRPAVPRPELTAEFAPKVARTLSVASTEQEPVSETISQSPQKEGQRISPSPQAERSTHNTSEPPAGAKSKPSPARAASKDAKDKKARPATLVNLSPKPRDAYTRPSVAPTRAKTVGYVRDEPAVTGSPAQPNAEEEERTGPPIVSRSEDVSQDPVPTSIDALDGAPPVIIVPADAEASENPDRSDEAWAAEIRSDRKASSAAGPTTRR